jgi:hypothetical protein
VGKQVQVPATAAGPEFKRADGGGPDAVDVGDDEEGLVERERSYTTVSVCCAALAALSVHAQAHAQAGAAKEVTGPYVGAAFGSRELDDSNSSNDDQLGRSAKIYGGYQLTENFGVQVGYVRLNELNRNCGSGATLVTQTATGRRPPAVASHLPAWSSSQAMLLIRSLG